MRADPAPEFRAIRRRNRLMALFPWVENLLEWRQCLIASARWRRSGWFAPVPYFVRRAHLLTLGKQIGATTVIETGTYRGDTTLFLARHFPTVHTIEVEHNLAALARERFADKPGITLWQGDSPTVLAKLMADAGGPLLVYLDGHDSGGVTGKGTESCPVMSELECIREGKLEKIIIVIDDARLFGLDPAYPTLSQIRQFAEKHMPDFTVRTELDAIIIEPLP